MKMIAYAHKKCQLRLDQLLLQSFLAGFWVAVYGHCCTVFASAFADAPTLSDGLTRLVYGILFPGAFVAVVYTGTELFTGNTVTMVMLLFNEGQTALKDLARVWIFSFFGNLGGATFGAFFFSYLSGVFQNDPARKFLHQMASHKLGHGFGQSVVLGVGCNVLVCLATWCVVCSDDGAGKILAMFYSVGVFAMGGFEHVVANFYTLSAALMCGYKEHNFGHVVVKNWIPVALGNVIAGTLFTGAMWWYALHPQYNDLAPFSNEELTVELTNRVNSAIAETGAGEDGRSRDLGEGLNRGVRWRRGVSNALTNKGSRFAPPHLVPNPVDQQGNQQGVAAGGRSSSLLHEYSITVPSKDDMQPSFTSRPLPLSTDQKPGQQTR